MNINHLLIIFGIIAFIFIVTYDPKKGNIHKQISHYQPNDFYKEGYITLRPSDLRYGHPTRIKSDETGAIFYPEKSIKQS